MNKEELLKAIMKHAVTGHTAGGEEWHKFCNDPQHALDILAANHHTVRPTFGGLAEDAATSEGMPVDARSERFA